MTLGSGRRFWLLVFGLWLVAYGRPQRNTQKLKAPFDGAFEGCQRWGAVASPVWLLYYMAEISKMCLENLLYARKRRRKDAARRGDVQDAGKDAGTVLLSNQRVFMLFRQENRPRVCPRMQLLNWKR